MKQLLRGHENDSEAQLALARLLVRTGRTEEATAVVDRAYEIDPSSARIAVLQARLRQRANDAEGALRGLEEFLERAPESGLVRMAYARMLVDARRYEQARAEFEHLVAEEPENDDARYALGLLFVQTDRLEEAIRQFEALATPCAAPGHRALLPRPDRGVAGALRRRRPLVSARATRGAPAECADQGRGAAGGRRRGRGGAASPARSAQRDHAGSGAHLQRRGGTARALCALRRSDGASTMRRSRRFPAIRISSTHAACSLRRWIWLDVLERDMRAIIAREPDNADALNALGYTLADRTDRLEEAYALIKRAIELKPDDHYIIDSLGWVLHRLGRHREALVQLRRAMSINPDPEIAAHLGEVLWVLGNKVEAAGGVEHRARGGARRRAPARRYRAFRALMPAAAAAARPPIRVSGPCATVRAC